MFTSFVVASITASATASKIRDNYGSLLNLEPHNRASSHVADYFGTSDSYYNDSYNSYAESPTSVN